MSERVRIDRDECMGAGKCVTAAPLAFALDQPDELAAVLPGVEDLDTTRLQSIIDECPAQAISWAEGEPA